MSVEAVETQTATTENQPPPAIQDEPITHVAFCRRVGCNAGVKFQPTRSGASFVILERYGMDVDATIGISEHALPICPVDDHGEMRLADDKLPVGEALEKVQEQLQGGELEPLQRSLPGVFPVFNYEGCFNELVEKAKEVQRLKIQYDEDKATAAESKKAWEKAAEVHMKMALEFDRRRREKPEMGEGEGSSTQEPNLVRCTYERENPDHEEGCPICGSEDEFAAVMGAQPPARDSEAHADAVRAYVTRCEVNELVDALLEIGHVIVPANTVLGWTAEQRTEAHTWLAQLEERRDGEQPPERPAFMGTSHVADDGDQESGDQKCRECGLVLMANDPESHYAPGTLVGVDFPGPGQAYPKTGGRKRKK